MVRNEFAFHHDLQRIRTQLSNVEESDKLNIYVADNSNVFFQVSEIVAGSAMLEGVEPGDFEAATTRLFTEMNEVCREFVTFCDGSLHYMIASYIGYDSADELEIPDPPTADGIQLSFFSS